MDIELNLLDHLLQHAHSRFHGFDVSYNYRPLLTRFAQLAFARMVLNVRE